MEFIYGVELYEATVLAISAERINELAIRQLRVRGARTTPGSKPSCWTPPPPTRRWT